MKPQNADTSSGDCCGNFIFIFSPLISLKFVQLLKKADLQSPFSHKSREKRKK